MTAKWETYTGISRSLDFAVISILRTGTLSLNPLATKLLGENVRHVELLYDREGKKIGLRPLQEAKPNARKVSQGKHTNSVNVKGFLDEYGIQHEKTRRYRVEKSEDGILVIEFGKPL